MLETCDLCGEETPQVKKKIVAQKYITRPYRRYLTENRWNLCEKCYNEVLIYIKRKHNKRRS